jgi:hypothetical protein
MEMDFKQLAQAIRVIAEEKNLPEEQVQDVVQQALAAAWRRDYGDREQEVRVIMNLNTGEVTAFVTKEVVEEGRIRTPRSVCPKPRLSARMPRSARPSSWCSRSKTLAGWPPRPPSR